jgi:hypothetical protein
MSPSPDTPSTAIDVQDLITRQTGSAAANMQDLSSMLTSADSHSSNDSDVSQLNTTVQTISDRRLTKTQADTTHSIALMSTEAKEIRCLEIEQQEAKLKQELPTLIRECQPHYRNWHVYNRRYLHLKAQIDSLTRTRVPDALALALFNQATNLIALDNQRAKAQAGITRVMRRDLEISVELRELAVEWAKLKGVEGVKESDEKIEAIEKDIMKQHESRGNFGKRLFWYASRAGGY